MAEDFWMGDDPTLREVRLSVAGAGGAVWSFGLVGGERLDPLPPHFSPPRPDHEMYYAASPDKLFAPVAH